ncbi:MAG: MFS transporter [Gammaproteobacteria bacterium]|nr:MFS transporter [Gammaproteobacteria bacterium]
MTPLERRVALSLAGIYGLRMLGLFMILPVFALYGQELEHYTPFLVGMAIGAYGLTQALLQIPFGMLSDRYGRKRIIAIGLVLFAAGSVLAAVSQSIYGVIAGRALQGSGAIAAAVMALNADLTRETQRTKAMAIIGVSIGMSFALAIVLGPVLNHWIGVPGIFWITGALALLGLVVLAVAVPRPATLRRHRDTEAVPDRFREVLADGQLLRLYAGIFLLQLIMTASFVALPLALRDRAGLEPAHHWIVYLPVLAASVVGLVPLIAAAERWRRMKLVFLASVAALGLAEVGLGAYHDRLWAIVGLLVVYFTAFNVLEASLPSLVSKAAPPLAKGTAMGVYSSAQFLGAFLGGAAGGWLLGAYGLGGVFGACAAVAAAWLGLAATMRRPSHLASYLLPVGTLGEAEAQALADRLMHVPGVAEAVVVSEEGVAYLKVDNRRLDEAALREFSAVEA